MTEISYYPGCSLATTAKENNTSLIYLFRHLGFDLVELEDWNCCGSSSAHSINKALAFDLASRNLSLAPPDRPLLVACPSCLLRLRQAHFELKKDPAARTRQMPFNADLEILHFFEILDGLNLSEDNSQHLSGLKFAAYYGCMLAGPPVLSRTANYHGLMEKILASLGAKPVKWAYSSRCCGTFLTVARPDVVTPIINEIIQSALQAGADCIVTACAMCHLNLEVRATLKRKIPVLHFSELISLALGLGKEEQRNWFARHLVDPRPLLKTVDLL
ncbi:MAG: heterodisulfide reductase-related iron-sulfur binding cluster [Desulfobacterales bacterium]